MKKIKSFVSRIKHYNYYKDIKNQVEKIRKTGIVESNGRFIYEPTVRCNLNCKMCYIPNKIKHSKQQELNFEQIKSLFTPLVPHMKTVNIIGGEPFCRQDIMEIIKFFTDNDIKINTLATNATLISSEKAVMLSKNDKLELVGVSIDSACREIHDEIRGIKGSFDRSVSAIKELAGLGKKAHIISVILPDNYNNLKEIVDLGKELKVEKIIFEYERYYTELEIANTNKMLGLNSEEIDMPASSKTGRGYKFSDLKKNVDELIKYAHQKNMNINFFPGYFLDNMKDYYNRETRKKNKVFCSAFFRPRIDQAGNLFFCYLIKKKIANLTQEKLYEVWNGKEIREFRQALLKNNMSPICEGCFYLRML